VDEYAYHVAKLPLVDIRPARKNPVDLTGCPRIDLKTNTTVWTRPEFILDVPAVYKVEEIAAAPRLLQVALHEFVGDWRIGNYAIHPDSLIVTTGNRPEDMAHVERVSSALRNRYVAVTMKADTEAFLKWGTKAGLHPLVAGFIEFRREMVSIFDGKKWDGISGYPSPRSWHQVSDLMHHGLGNSPLLLNVVAGSVGTAAAIEFDGYVKVHSRVISPEIIALDPVGTPIPDELVECWATASAIAFALNNTNAPALVTYLNRMPLEFSAFAIKSAIGRNRTLLQVSEVKAWAIANQSVLMGR
jgi:hypothetical protein